MALKLNNLEVNFELKIFTDLISEAQRGHSRSNTFTNLISMARGGQINPRSKIFSLYKLLNLSQSNPQRFPISHEDIINEISKLDFERQKKYKKALKYLIYYHPSILAPDRMRYISLPIPLGTAFSEAYNKRKRGRNITPPDSEEYNDVVYGLASSRNKPIYGEGFRIMDDFNNASNLGTGVAFGNRAWVGYGDTGATDISVLKSFEEGEKLQGNKVGNVFPKERLDYVNFITGKTSPFGAHFSPIRSFSDSLQILKQNQYPTKEWMRKNIYSDEPDEIFEQQCRVHLQFIQAVRRACKGGIAMVGTDLKYRPDFNYQPDRYKYFPNDPRAQIDKPKPNERAYVHFVLDGMGDLGNAAYKTPTFKDTLSPYGDYNKDYVSITTTELCFCARNWNNPLFRLSSVIVFYINGKVVPAPWEAQYRYLDVDGKIVYSNQEAWLRYKLRRDLMVRRF